MVDLSRVPGPGLPAGRDSSPESDSACPSGIPRPRHKALSMVLQRFLSLVLHRFLISSPDLGIDVGFCLFMNSCVHRFLISSPDLRIDVGFCLFMHSCVHRFLISGQDLGIDASFSPFTPSCVHRFLNSSPDLGIDAAENSFACYGRSSNEVPRPTLFYVAAKGDGFACYGRLRHRHEATDSNFRCCKEKKPDASPSELQDE